MKARFILTLAAAAASLGVAGEADAQRVRVHDVPARPAMWAGADTNSATTYYNHGLSVLEERPAEAAAAFYWASRLNPGWADPLYARRVALMMADPRRLVNYIDGNRTTLRNPEVLAIDSLQLRALSLDPFLFQKLDKQLIKRYLLTVYTEASKDYAGNPDAALASFAVERQLDHADPFYRAWLAYSEGRFPAAIEQYERELRGARNKLRMRSDLARLHYLSGNYARSIEHLNAALEIARNREDREVVFVYENKAMLQHSLATVHARAGDAAAAREAYGRALQEDLAFAPAHARLSALALAAGDTASALSEMALAVETAPGDAVLHYDHGVLLARGGRIAEAVAELKRAAELEPYYAAPHFLLAFAHDRSDMHAEALEHYQAFLERAPRDDPQRARAAARVAELRSAHGRPHAVNGERVQASRPVRFPPNDEGCFRQ
jgi:tetratricopeptide (TPR) repeat protein